MLTFGRRTRFLIYIYIYTYICMIWLGHSFVACPILLAVFSRITLRVFFACLLSEITLLVLCSVGGGFASKSTNRTRVPFPGAWR